MILYVFVQVLSGACFDLQVSRSSRKRSMASSAASSASSGDETNPRDSAMAQRHSAWECKDEIWWQIDEIYWHKTLQASTRLTHSKEIYQIQKPSWLFVKVSAFTSARPLPWSLPLFVCCQTPAKYLSWETSNQTAKPGPHGHMKNLTPNEFKQTCANLGKWRFCCILQCSLHGSKVFHFAHVQPSQGKQSFHLTRMRIRSFFGNDSICIISYPSIYVFDLFFISSLPCSTAQTFSSSSNPNRSKDPSRCPSEQQSLRIVTW